MMETATLTSPPRTLMVQPIQKSLSLPSYAKAGGEGIDHKIIFAALEQREKIRRKSKIFKDKEKCGTTRQNYFCLPLPLTTKCRETSFSSDTSCSSLEFQKPKCRASPAKLKTSDTDRTHVQNGFVETGMNSPSPVQHADPILTKEFLSKDNSKQDHRPTLKADVSRSTIGSSDSMERTERSSKSSNDSLSRKERLVAIKARVEAEREKKFNKSSSDEEEDLRITRHNSDGVIHRTVRDVKAKSSRYDKRYRRKTQDEMAMRRALRKQHTSLYLPHTTDFDSWKPPIQRSGSSFSLQRDIEEFSREFLSTDHKANCSPPVSSNSILNPNYFSDICNDSLGSRYVKPKVQEIESKQIESKLSALRREQIKQKTCNYHDNDDNFVDYKQKLKHVFYNSRDNPIEKVNCRYRDDDSNQKCPSPICRAPTPPPRSPKSIEFINKVFLQHQKTSNLLQEARSLERKKHFTHSNLPSATNTDNNIYSHQSNCLQKAVCESTDSPFSSRRNKDTNLRRKTLCSFPQVDEIAAGQRPKTPTVPPRTKFPLQNFPPRSPDFSHKICDASRKTKGYASGSDISVSKPMMQQDVPGKKWEKLELDSEKKFNSLENRSKANMSMWFKDRWQPRRKSPCSCTDPNECPCVKHQNQRFKVDKKYIDMFQIGTLENSHVKANAPPGENKVSKSMPTSKTPPIPLDRLSRSEANLSKRSPPKTPSPKMRPKELFSSKNVPGDNEQSILFNRHVASENLDTAMEELENVYRSLRISSENLSSVADEQDESSSGKRCLSKQPANAPSCLEGHSIKRSHRNFFPEPFLLEEKSIKDTNSAELEIPVANSSIDADNDKSCLHDALCIEELFSDLTQQLDFEQKQLQDSKNRKILNNTQQSNCNLNSHELPKSVECSTDLIKCAYEVESEIKPSDPQPNLKEALTAKRKQEAIESLSANLSYLMKNNTSLSETKQEKSVDYPSPMKKLENKCQSKFENNTAVKSPVLESASLCQRSDDSDEIWQVRVSMNSDTAHIDSSKPSSKPDHNSYSYSRLRSAVRSPRPGNSREPSPCPILPCFREKTVDSSSDLEKMLTNLLYQVPQSKINVRPSQADTQTKEPEYPKTSTKDVTHQDLRKHCLVNMDGGISSKDVMENGKKNTQSFQGARKHFSEKKMDNDSLRNNNYSSQTQRLSLIPVRSRGNHRGKYALPKYKSCDDNRSVTSQLNLPFVGNSSYPVSPFQSPVRRHSLGVDDLSDDLSIHVNSNFGQRFQSLGRHGNSSNTPNAASNTYNLTSFEKGASNHPTYHDLLHNGKGNQNDKYQFLHRSSNNTSPRPFSPTCSESSQPSERLKDKSFIRKSSLNRIEFANSTPHHHQAAAEGPPYAACFYSPEQHSTSEANSDNPDHPTPPSEMTAASSVKRKGNYFRLNKKDASGRQTKQNFPGVNARKEEEPPPNINAALSPKLNDRSAWWRNRKAYFKKKSYSAGEQDSLTDNSDIWKCENLYFSAQEIDSQGCRMKCKKVIAFEPKKQMQSLPQPPDASAKTDCMSMMTVQNVLQDQTSTCDNTSQANPGKVLDTTVEAEMSQDVSSLNSTNEAGVSKGMSVNPDIKPDDDDDNGTIQIDSNIHCSAAPFEDMSLDGDLFVCPKSPPLKSSLHPFPIDDIEQNLPTVSTSIENTENCEAILECSADNQEDEVDKVSSEISSLDISTDSLETNLTTRDSDATKQRNSIMRRKSDDRKGIHGILKYADDDKLSWQPLSILKHRESSEEKENWSQSDLHSILKKSASEDESCNGNSDIRPILKNTSTDEESSGLTSKPRPILKKRTSFSEECSYACFLSGELKPILKKKTLNESSEDQPKPILKIRRKSEEATASISEFPLGTRPRAYSADRGVRMCSEKKSHDDDLT